MTAVLHYLSDAGTLPIVYFLCSDLPSRAGRGRRSRSSYSWTWNSDLARSTWT